MAWLVLGLPRSTFSQNEANGEKPCEVVLASFYNRHPFRLSLSSDLSTANFFTVPQDQHGERNKSWAKILSGPRGIHDIKIYGHSTEPIGLRFRMQGAPDVSVNTSGLTEPMDIVLGFREGNLITAWWRTSHEWDQYVLGWVPFIHYGNEISIPERLIKIGSEPRQLSPDQLKWLRSITDDQTFESFQPLNTTPRNFRIVLQIDRMIDFNVNSPWTDKPESIRHKRFALEFFRFHNMYVRAYLPDGFNPKVMPRIAKDYEQISETEIAFQVIVLPEELAEFMWRFKDQNPLDNAVFKEVRVQNMPIIAKSVFQYELRQATKGHAEFNTPLHEP